MGPVMAQHFHQQCPFYPQLGTFVLDTEHGCNGLFFKERVHPASYPYFLSKGNSPIVGHLVGGLCPPPTMDIQVVQFLLLCSLWRSKYGLVTQAQPIGGCDQTAQRQREGEDWSGQQQCPEQHGRGQPWAGLSWLLHLLCPGSQRFPWSLSGF